MSPFLFLFPAHEPSASFTCMAEARFKQMPEWPTRHGRRRRRFKRISLGAQPMPMGPVRQPARPGQFAATDALANERAPWLGLENFDRGEIQWPGVPGGGGWDISRKPGVSFSRPRTALTNLFTGKEINLLKFARCKCQSGLSKAPILTNSTEMGRNRPH